MSKPGQQEFERLMKGYLENSLSAAELRLFFSLLNDPLYGEQLEQQLEHDLAQPDLLNSSPENARDPDFRTAFERFRFILDADQKTYEQPKSLVRTIKRLSIAATILIAVSVGSYFYFNEPVTSKQSTEARVTQFQKIKPGSQVATLTLSNGEQIIIDSAGTGLLANEGETEVVRNNGSIAYYGKNDQSGSRFNTLKTGRGQESPPLLLADGSKVWLNAMSSIRFPVVFSGEQRLVEITGEAYFDIAHDVKRPFIVKTKDVEVEVVGTEFNVMNYDDEESSLTTVLRGKVKVRHATDEVVLLPSMQGKLRKSTAILNTSTVEADKYIGWRNGMIEFQDDDLSFVMRQVARWYNINISFEGDVSTQRFSGSISRNSTLGNSLEILKAAGVDFSIENGTLTVFRIK